MPEIACRCVHVYNTSLLVVLNDILEFGIWYLGGSCVSGEWLKGKGGAFRFLCILVQSGKEGRKEVKQH